MELSSLNKKHEEMLNKYVKFVQGTSYTATEDYESSKFLEFQRNNRKYNKYTLILSINS